MASKTTTKPKKTTTKKPTSKKLTAKKVTAKKTVAKKTVTKKTAVKKTTAKKNSSKIRFPRRELNSWLKNNPEWDHNTWSALLEELNSMGFGEWTDNKVGQDALGLYLEGHRK